jgi:hypothetical protein
MVIAHDNHGHIVFSPSVQRLLDQVMAGSGGIAVRAGEYCCDGCVLQHFREPVTAKHNQIVRSHRRRGQFRFHIDAHPQAFGQDVTLRMCKRRGRIDQAPLHKFFDEGVIARQLLELSCPIWISTAISQVGDVGDRHRCRRNRQGHEGRPHPLQGRFRQDEIMDSSIGARQQVCHEFRCSTRVLAEPGRSFSSPLCGHGHGGLGREIPSRVTTHPICHNPDAAIIQDGQRILVRGSNMTRFCSTDPGPLLELCHGATSAGSW